MFLDHPWTQLWSFLKRRDSGGATETFRENAYPLPLLLIHILVYEACTFSARLRLNHSDLKCAIVMTS
jgi:hypothetical protein